ncbi:uncharacterized protein LOC134349138 [Mobula hypostoma]|uniref:uncharacterized protein LOC134349138 n=1 Tax=Mobula hypostoma TaxID=723540 RepID=UPI002FC2BFBB
MVVGDSIVRGTERGFCGNRRDLRMVCCLPGARIQDVTDRVQGILKSEGEDPEVVVHVGTNDVGKNGKDILQRDFRELGRRLKSRTSRVVISGLLPVPRAGLVKNREIMDLNMWLRNWCRKQGFTFLDHWRMFRDRGDPGLLLSERWREKMPERRGRRRQDEVRLGVDEAQGNQWRTNGRETNTHNTLEELSRSGSIHGKDQSTFRAGTFRQGNYSA